GFEAVEQVVTIAGASVTQDITLKIKGVSENIQVQAQSADEITTESVEPAATLSEQQLTTLPLVEEKFTEALPLVPGVIRTFQGNLNFKGQSENLGLLLIDSTENVDPVTGSFSVPIPVEAIQSMVVDNVPKSAEYGGFSGGLTRIET